jgi:hypothetical protein
MWSRRDWLRARLVPILGIVAVALAAVSMVAPWWVVQYQGVFFHYPVDGWDGYGLFGWTSVNVMTRWPEYPNQTTTQSGNYANLSGMGFVLAGGGGLDAAGIACAVASLALVALPRLMPWARKLGPVAGVGGSALFLTSALYVMAKLPPAADEDMFPVSWFIFNTGPVVSGYWGSGSAGWMHGVTYATYGAGLGWYALVAAAALMLLNAILSTRGSQTHVKAGVRKQRAG